MLTEKLNDIKLNRYSVRLKFTEEVNFNYFHGSKIYSLVVAIINKHPLGSNIILNLPEIGRLKYRAGSFYNFGINIVNANNEFEKHVINSFRKVKSGNFEKSNYPFNFESLDLRKISIPTFKSILTGDIKEIDLSFVSPLRMLKKNRQKGSRYFSPQYFDCDQFFELLFLRVYKDLFGIKIPEKKIPEKPIYSLKSKTLIWVDMPKANNTTIGGVIGKVKMRVFLTKFWELLLWYGQFLHVGNNSSFGFGQYYVENYKLKPSIRPDKNFLEIALNSENFKNAFDEIKSNNGQAGIDDVTLEDYEANLYENIDNTKADIKEKKYKPKDLLGFIIPRKTEKIRALSIPTVRDRVIQRAVVQAIAKPIDKLLEESSFAYRSGFSREGAAKKISQAYYYRYEYVLEFNISAFFDSVDWDILFAKLDVIFYKDPIVSIIKRWVKSPVVYNGKKIKRNKGLSQGAIISPLLANLYLDEFDEIIKKDFKLIKYEDNFLLLCKSKEKSNDALSVAKKTLKKNDLDINYNKTRILDFDSGFQYLGYLFCKSLVSEKNSGKKIKTKFNLDSAKIPAGSWLTLVDFNKIKKIKKYKLNVL